MSAISIKKLVEEAEKDFKSSYWQQALAVKPPPQAELIRVLHNADSGSSIPILTILDDGTVRFTTRDTAEIDHQLFIWIAIEEPGSETRYLFMNATRTHVLYIEDIHVKTEDVKSISAKELMSESKYFFSIPENNQRDNCLLTPWKPDNRCQNCSLEYKSDDELFFGSQHFRYKIDHIADIEI